MFLASGTASAQKISIFCDHINTIAGQERISFAEAAARVKAIGYTAVDLEVTTSPERIQVLDSLGFAYASVVARIDYAHGPQPEMEQRVLDFVKARGSKSILIVPGFITDSANVDKAVTRFVDFAKRTEAIGVRATVEDYDDSRSLCYNIARLNQFICAYKGIGHTFDTGNYLFAGEDCLKAMRKFRKRIVHVHLKDRRSPTDLSCPPVGTGCIPIDEVIRAMVKRGYDGWFTVEEFGSRQMLKDATESYAHVKAAIEQASSTK